ncbi:hypothetical protein B0H17DRAFT_1087522 [Mycena rosella]|uniref:Uncharacterized protein n=1 Tax=Mycena rosella TaxID=1033263 RepID=A0AAD7CXV2_MYCRO|nr:hypothetical protein B0H17DRAFT_1087522 [Mycena rosella]
MTAKSVQSASPSRRASSLTRVHAHPTRERRPMPRAPTFVVRPVHAPGPSKEEPRAPPMVRVVSPWCLG